MPISFNEYHEEILRAALAPKKSAPKSVKAQADEKINDLLANQEACIVLGQYINELRHKAVFTRGGNIVSGFSAPIQVLENNDYLKSREYLKQISAEVSHQQEGVYYSDQHQKTGTIDGEGAYRYIKETGSSTLVSAMEEYLAQIKGTARSVTGYRKAFLDLLTEENYTGTYIPNMIASWKRNNDQVISR